MVITKKLRIFYLSLLACFSLGFTSIFFFTSFNGVYFYEKMCGPNKFCELGQSWMYEIRNHLDISKLSSVRLFEGQATSINIITSRDDIRKLNKQVKKSFDEGFHRDEWKTYRSVDVDFGELSIKKAKIKIHGTAITPIYNGFSVLKKIKLKVLGANSDNLDRGIGDLATSLKLKLPTNQFYDGARRLILLSYFDDWDATSIGITKLAKKMGLVVSVPELRQLFFNGYDAGLYLFYENFGKELLERNYAITNYSILKSNDVWDKSEGFKHTSSTDFTSFDKEQSGMRLTSEFALGKLETLFEAAFADDLPTILSLVNIDDFAKISAIENLYGTSHSTAGDNLRYLYDAATGRFRLILRIEGGALDPNYNNGPMNSKDLTTFDDQVYKASGYGKNIIFEALMKNKIFLEKRTDYLNYIKSNRGYIIGESLASVEKLKNLDLVTSRENRRKINQSLRSIENLKNNLDAIEDFINHQKVFVTHNITNSALEILNNSNRKLRITGLLKCDGEIYLFPTEQFIKPTFLKKANFQPNVIPLPAELECVSNLIDGDSNHIENKNFFINRKRLSDIRPINTKTFQNIFDGNVNIDGDTWIIRAGNYFLMEDLYFPNEVNLVLKPGVKMHLGENVNIFLRGNLTALGTANQNVTIQATNSDKPFGSFGVLGHSGAQKKVELSYFKISGGSEDIVNGVYFSGQMSTHYCDVYIRNSSFSQSKSDDGLNIKFGYVDITASEFFSNSFDAFDCDFCSGKIYSNKFISTTVEVSLDAITDGLDVSGSDILVTNNDFFRFTDKAISVGENSTLTIMENSIYDSNIGVAVKDGSIAKLHGNMFVNNEQNYISYVKKLMYGQPSIEILE